MALPLAKLRLYLSLIPLLRSRPGISFKEIGEHLGISANAAQKEIPEALMLCGVPPYMPHDYIACFTEGDKVTVRFADHFERPAKLTLAEVTAVLVALRALPPARGAPEAKAAAGLIRKLERALGTKQVKKLARRIGARRASGVHGERIKVLDQAVAESREVEIEYYTQRRRVLSKRRVRPYALIEHLGNVYLVGRDSARGRELSFRLDRIKLVELTEKTFDKPASFNAQRYRRADFYRPGASDKTVRLRVGAGAARYVRETRPASEVTQKASGSVECALRTDSMRWAVDYALQHADEAEVLGPAPARKEARQVLDDWLAFYDEHKR